MRGYDDTETIRRVREIMESSPGRSRRSVIIEICGEENLRRIEMKMSSASAPVEATEELPDGLREVFGDHLSVVRGRIFEKNEYIWVRTKEGRDIDLDLAWSGALVGHEIVAVAVQQKVLGVVNLSTGRSLGSAVGLAHNAHMRMVTFDMLGAFFFMGGAFATAALLSTGHLWLGLLALAVSPIPISISLLVQKSIDDHFAKLKALTMDWLSRNATTMAIES